MDFDIARNLRKVLSLVAHDTRLYFVKAHAGEKSIPFTEMGLNHFEDCPHFRKTADTRQQSLLEDEPSPGATADAFDLRPRR